jgi:dihydrofolate synthase / folylpolyglutamate synthase
MVVNNYQEAVEYLYRNLPMFQRIGSAAYKPDLSNTIKLLGALGDPQKKFRSIHVGGTNGKGSTSHMLASILQSSGYKTGLYTSPHLKDFTERIKVNGQEVSQHFVINFVNRLHGQIQEMKPSFFEITVAMAFDFFAEENVDVAVIEVGLGGRLDSTNVIEPMISVITNIGWDHKDILGDTLPKIAAEKAGIIKRNIPVVVSERQHEVQDVFIEKANDQGAPVFFASDEYQAEFTDEPDGEKCTVLKTGMVYLRDLKLPLRGLYQEKNLPGVLKVIELLQQAGLRIDFDQIRHGLEHVILQTKFKGRWQKLRSRPLVICDTGHNVDGIRQVVKQILREKYRKLHIVWGMVRDKEIMDILRLLPKDASYYFCQAKIPRALDAEVLAERAHQLDLKGIAIADVNAALQEALNVADDDDFIFVGGSTFVVAEIDGL